MNRADGDGAHRGAPLGELPATRHCRSLMLGDHAAVVVRYTVDLGSRRPAETR